MSSNSKGNGHKHITETPDVSHIRNVEITHEQSDISVSGVLTFMAVLTVGTIVVSVGTWLMFRYFSVQEEKEQKPGPMPLSKQDRLPPAPRLQGPPGFGVTLEKGETISPK